MARRNKRKALLPKRIAGVKVPKSVRKGPLGDLLASRTGQALLAEAIMAAGAVGVAKHASDKTEGANGQAAEPPQLTGGMVADAFRRWQGAGGRSKNTDAMGATVAYALGEAARTFVRTLNEARAQHGAKPEEEPESQWSPTEVDEVRGSKKKPASLQRRR